MQFARMISAVDAHACGEPGRVITGGVLDVPGKTMFEKKVYLETHADDMRKLMLREPRGYPASNCNLILPPTHPEADAGFVIMEQTEYPPMSGTNTICVVTVLIETGMIPIRGRHHEAETRYARRPGGSRSRNRRRKGHPRHIPECGRRLRCTSTRPSRCRSLGTVKVDVAYGGMFYVIADAEPLGLRLTPDEARDIVRVGEMIKAAAQEQLPVSHPENPAISGVTIAQLSAPSTPSGSRPQKHGDRIHRQARLEPPLLVDRRSRPLALRHWHLRQNGGAPRQRRSPLAAGFRARGNSRNHFHRAPHRRDPPGRPRGRNPHDHRPRMDHGIRPVRRGR